PYRQIGGNINISTNLYNARTFNNAANVLNNTLRSSFNFNYRWPESPFKFSMGLDHNQNNLTREVNLTLPTANLNMNSINPFKRKNGGGEDKWYESIVLGYNASFRNFIKATDTTLFTPQILDNLQLGMDQNANLSTNFRILKYINVSPSAQVTNINFFRILERNLLDTLQIDTFRLGTNSLGESVFRRDTTFGVIKDQYVSTFSPYLNGNLSVSANTQLFYTKQFTKGFIRGFRHVMKPSVGLNYSPDTKSVYERFVDTDTREGFNRPLAYNPFVGGAYNASLGQKNLGISWGINHIFEGKYRGKKDTLDKKFKLFENMYWAGNYNFAADSMRWSDVSINGTTQILKGLSTFSFRGLATPYELDNRTRRLNKFVFERTKFPVQLAEFNGSFNTGLSFTQIRDIFKGKKDDTNSQNTNQQQGRGNRSINQNDAQGFMDLFNDFRINHNMTFSVRKVDGRDTLTLDVNSIQIYGSLRLTQNWRLDLGNISYDLKSKQFVYPSLSFARDLHCWNMRFSWFPDRGVYSFFIGVKSGAFNFLKYDYTQRNQNAMFNPFGR
ncbi:MAG TPA: putative LPS assembly protein LptD, partial [Saprospiraceae bacterium]|nr:putative LPS assembly protein LptD [Saprospiraceae bacterium]